MYVCTFMVNTYVVCIHANRKLKGVYLHRNHMCICNVYIWICIICSIGYPYYTIQQWLNGQEVVKKLICYIHPEADSEV